MDFAPYQESPETQRVLSPPPPEGRRSFSPIPRRSFSPALPSPRNANANASAAAAANANNPWEAVDDHIPGVFRSSYFGGGGGYGDVEGGGGAGGGGRERLNEFETSLPIRLDYEACLAYLLLPPAGGVLLLLLEHKSDYVRFHAWQSALLFSAVFFLHLIFAWSSFMSWVIFLGDLGLIGYLTMRAYKDADTLDRCEVPFFGRLASRFLDDE